MKASLFDEEEEPVRKYYAQVSGFTFACTAAPSRLGILASGGGGGGSRKQQKGKRKGRKKKKRR